jgi:hypothetical protein
VDLGAVPVKNSRVGHQVPDIAHKQQRASRQGHLPTRSTGVNTVSIQAAGEGFPALGHCFGQRAFENATGVQMKVIIGSQIASEGVDLRFVRETHIIDSWFHLNKTEQIQIKLLVLFGLNICLYFLGLFSH